MMPLSTQLAAYELFAFEFANASRLSSDARESIDLNCVHRTSLTELPDSDSNIALVLNANVCAKFCAPDASRPFLEIVTDSAEIVDQMQNDMTSTLNGNELSPCLRLTGPNEGPFIAFLRT